MIRAGDTLENPITGERIVFRQTSRETNGEAVVIETYVQPDGFVAAAHVHPSQEERFEVLRGAVGFRVGRTKLVAEWHFHPSEIAKKDFVFADAIDFWDRTNREDWAISEQSYLGISSRGYQPGPYSEREKQLWEFDQFILSRVT